MNRLALVAVLCACGHKPESIAPTAPQALPNHVEVSLDTSPKASRRVVPPEAFLRAYLAWFGGLSPIDVAKQTQRSNLFDRWNEYLASIGLPDYQLDMPRVTQINLMRLATYGRLAEALCVKSVEHDLHGRTPTDRRVVFAFDVKPGPSLDDFKIGFDVLHRTFLGYPAELAPAGRVDRFYALYRQVVANHAATSSLTADELGWVAVCSALVQHPEAELY